MQNTPMGVLIILPNVFNLNIQNLMELSWIRHYSE